MTNATGGTFTLTFNGQTTAPLAFNATAAQIDAALEALSNAAPATSTATGGPVNTANVTVELPGALGADRPAAADRRRNRADRHARRRSRHNTTTTGGLYQRPTGDDRRSTLNTNDRRGKMLRIQVKDGDITPAEANKANFGSGGAYTIPAGNLFPLVSGQPRPKTEPEVYAMGFRNPFRLQVDENNVAYVSDYSPDSQNPQQFRGPSGVGPLPDRPPAGKLRLADVLREQPRLLPVELQPAGPAATNSRPRADRLRAPIRSPTTPAGT